MVLVNKAALNAGFTRFYLNTCFQLFGHIHVAMELLDGIIILCSAYCRTAMFLRKSTRCETRAVSFELNPGFVISLLHDLNK